MTTDPYGPYRTMLAGEDVPIHADQPYPGRYKLKRGDRFLPVLINYDQAGNLVADVDGVLQDPVPIWTHCAKHAVDKDSYSFRKKEGRWPDEPEVIQRSNMPTDPLEALLAEIEDKRAQAEEYLSKNPEIKSQTTANLFRNLQNQLLTLIKRGDGLFEVEKRPILEATRACDEKYRFRAALSVVATRLRQRYEGFLKAEEDRLKKEADDKFKAEQERVRKEQERILTEAKKKMEDDPVAALTSDPVELPQLPLGPEPVKVSAGGGSGRRSGLQTVYVPQITDWGAALAHYVDHPDIRAALEKVVKAAVKSSKGTTKIPGVTIVKDRKVA